jgi:tRNA 2-thiocytidine biosynthesis protein TtcA
LPAAPLQRLPLLGETSRPRPAAAAALEKTIAHRVGRAIRDFRMIEAGDRVLVAVSGGKDSYTLLHVLEGLRRRAPVRFELLAVNVDQGYPGYRQDVVAGWLRAHGYRLHLVRAGIAEVVERHLEAGDHYCSLCSRLRRGVLYRVADELGATKVALGHHADDLVETLLLNLLFTGEIKAMPAKLRSDDGRHVVIRPLAYVPEDLVASFAAAAGFPLVCCMCPACGDETLKRKRIKRLLASLEAELPGVKKSLLRALSRVNTGHLLDRRWLELPAGGPARPPAGKEEVRPGPAPRAASGQADPTA